MTRLQLLLPLVCATGAAAAALAPSSAESASQSLPAAVVAPDAAKATGLGQPDQVGWLAGYGTYNVRRESWNLIPFGKEGRESWTLIPSGKEGC